MGEDNKPFYRLPFLLLSIFHLVSVVISDDAFVMNKLASSLKPTPSGWSGSDPCKWTGVNCDSNHRITAINLASRSLSGTLPSDLNQLSQLQILSLQNNIISGPLPSLANLTNLGEAYLDRNNFTSVPLSFFVGLESLQVLSLGENYNLAPWSIPLDLAQSSSLVTFYASKANVVGMIPDIFRSFPNLQSLRLSYNRLTGPLPPSFNGSNIQNLWLNNQDYGLSGTIEVLGTMTQLTQVWLQGNKFSGLIPDLSACTSLFDLQLRDNQFTGVVPTTLMSLPSLLNVSLSNNKLMGSFPEFNSNVQAIIGGINNFCNLKPGSCDSQVTALIAVAGGFGYPMALADAWDGNDPCHGWRFITCDTKNKNVTVINLANQHLSGKISPVIANLTSLRDLFLNDNNLTGPIPDALTTLPQLRVLDLSNNNLTGKIPAFPERVTVNISGNALLGHNSISSEEGGGSTDTLSSANSPSGSPKSPYFSPAIFAGTVVVLVFHVLRF